ncbi:hypothetical protein LOZ80_31595 [Paenibacillus sp. HWE-109]|uniref:hypothetical protein n=1 Tax=Paenibacillus sp. HWE-109 TaxID=1306526 RepID=UPI001EDDF490|nr:hypothetical protein [Paenibacillus sp. HWE-109]UKS26049.1 hypothetical protein LOZ80_31595 [Paenibacillus sp. HWE-109]
MAILSARFIVDGQFNREYTTSQIDSQLYQNTLRDYLYCPTPNCPSRVSYINRRRPFLKTWNGDDHDPNCIHAFERLRGRVGVDTTRFINVELSPERKKRALKEALAQYNMTEEEREQQRLKKVNRRNNPTTVEKTSQPSAKLVLVNGDITVGEEKTGFRGPNLPKRTPDMLKDSDEKRPRLIMGLVKDVKLLGSTAEIIIVEKGIDIHVKFEEVFHVNSPTFSGLFHLINRYLSDVKRVVFTGIGETKLSSDGTHYELSVFYGEDFEVNGMMLTVLAAHYARGA